jgi:Sel1 repeat
MLTSRSIYFICLFSFFYSQFIYADTFKEGGEAYIKGDYATAAKKFLEVAKKGDHRAMYALGSMYAGGTGVEKDYKEAYKWFSRAAKYGRVDAQYKLGLMYDEGAGVSQNYKRAARYYNKAAKKGYAHAQFKLGMLFAKGHGVKQSNVKAYAWLIVANQNLQNNSPREKETSGEIEQRKGDPFAAIHVDLIAEELETIRKNIAPEEIEKAKLLAQEYIQYR